MSNFFTKEEKSIIDKINRTEINCSNYIQNFIFCNPLNYPITSTIISRINQNDCRTVKDLFNSEKISRKISDHSDLLAHVLKECYLNNFLTFTSLIVSLLYSGNCASLSIIKRNGRVLFFIIPGERTYQIINEQCNKMIIFHDKYYHDVIEKLNSSEINSFDELLSTINLIINKYCIFDFSESKFSDTISRSIILSFLSGHRFFDLSIIRKLIDRDLLDSVICSLDDYCTITHLFNKEYIPDRCFVENTIQVSDFIQPEVVDFEGMDINL